MLFDTGKRNNLVNFHTTKQSGAEIVTPDAVTLFGLVGHSTRFEVMDTKGGDDDDLFEALDDEKIAITKEKLKESFDKKLKKGQILVYNPDNKPIRALKNINKKGKTAIEETGVNIVYCAFGFINWKEKDNADTVMKAPVLLIPAIIENESIAEPCRIRLTDDEVILNPTFAYKLEHEFGIKLPEYDDEEGIESYFAKLDELLSKIGWSLSRESRVGIFSFLKINMYQDL